ncbi:hypothetical protein IRJ41_008679 [Triplophysa rosa]|uniref:Uncharacterized protein n=1 Tax=Triplophysa rosa TaxID=992332 RepID=A0A9W7T8C3_TRIRA|nr:hypothetical protein IRJ41_008679 [Triplophysa rosa]
MVKISLTLGPEMECTSTFYRVRGALGETERACETRVLQEYRAGEVSRKGLQHLSGMFLSTDACRYIRWQTQKIKVPLSDAFRARLCPFVGLMPKQRREAGMQGVCVDLDFGPGKRACIYWQLVEENGGL